MDKSLVNPTYEQLIPLGKCIIDSYTLDVVIKQNETFGRPTAANIPEARNTLRDLTLAMININDLGDAFAVPSHPQHGLLRSCLARHPVQGR